MIQPGDFVLVQTNHFVSRLIRFGQRSYGRENAKWNHVALYIGNDRIIEALSTGICESPLDKYAESERRVISTATAGRRPADLDAADREMRENAVAFAESCVGEKYGWMTIAAIGLKTLFKGRFNFGVQGTSICSGLVARSLERMGYNFNPYNPAELTPAYLAKVLK